MELGQLSADIVVLRSRWARDHNSRFLAKVLVRPLTSASMRFLVAHNTQGFLSRGILAGHFVHLPTTVWPATQSF